MHCLIDKSHILSYFCRPLEILFGNRHLHLQGDGRLNREMDSGHNFRSQQQQQLPQQQRMECKSSVDDMGTPYGLEYIRQKRKEEESMFKSKFILLLLLL